MIFSDLRLPRSIDWQDWVDLNVYADVLNAEQFVKMARHDTWTKVIATIG